MKLKLKNLSLMALIATNLAVAEDKPSIEKTNPPPYFAYIQKVDKGEDLFFLRSKVALESPKFSPYSVYGVKEFKELKQIEGVTDGFTYSASIEASPNAVWTIRVEIPETKKVSDLDVTIPSSLTEQVTRLSRYSQSVSVQKSATATNSAQSSGSQSGNFWLDAVNAYRIQRGLLPQKRNAALEAISQQNDASGGWHNYTGGRVQIWSGYGDINAAINQWMGPYYSSHGVTLISSQYTEAGVYCGSHGCTITY